MNDDDDAVPAVIIPEEDFDRMLHTVGQLTLMLATSRNLARELHAAVQDYYANPEIGPAAVCLNALNLVNWLKEED